MNEDQKIIYARGLLLQAEITMQAMIAANKQSEIRGESPAYGETAFTNLIDEFGVHHNALIGNLRS